MVLRYIGDAQWTALDADAKPTNAAVADTLTTLDTRRIFIHQGSAVWIEIGVGGGGGGTGGGGGFAAGGTIAKSGDGTSVVISIAHGLSPTPDLFYALPLNAAARGIISYGIDGTNINLTYPIAPAAGTNNLSYVWGAGYVNSASGGFTPTSTTTLTGKTISELTNNLGIVQPYTWIVYKASSTLYKAKSGITGLTPYSGTNFKTDIWDNIKSNPASKTRIHFLNASTPYDIPSGSTMDIPSGAADYYLSGESPFGVILRPLGNNILMSTGNLRRAKFENFGIYIDQGASYTTDIFRFIPASGGVSEIEIAGLRMRHDDGTNTLSQTGRNIVLLLTGTSPSISYFNMHDCIIQGSDSAFTVVSTAVLAFPWANEVRVTRITAIHCKHFFISSLPAVTGVDPALHVTNSQIRSWTFRDCGWQTTGVDATTESMFRFLNDSSHSDFLIDGCKMWDAATTNEKFLSIPTATIAYKRIAIRNSHPISDPFMGGTSWDAANGKWGANVIVARESELSIKRGVTSVADGGTITHGLIDYTGGETTAAIAPRIVKVQATVAGEMASVTAISTTTFTVALKKHDGTAGTTQNVYWEAKEFV